MRVPVNNLNKLRRAISTSSQQAEQDIDNVSVEIATRWFQEIQHQQPIGKLDELADAAGRPARPSIRLGNQPIERGWLGGFRIAKDSATSRTLALDSESPHIKYFTRWTGRSYLGTKAGKPQVVHPPKKTLAFWWRGAARFPVSTPGHGFDVSRDFLQVAWDNIKDEIRELLRGAGRLILIRPFEEIIE